MLQGWYLNSRYTRDMKNNIEARTYAYTHIVLAKVQYEENRPAHLVLHTRDKQLKSAPHAGHQSETEILPPSRSRVSAHLQPVRGACDCGRGAPGGGDYPRRGVGGGAHVLYHT